MGKPTGRLPRDAAGIAHLALVAFGIVAASVTVIAVVESYSNLLAFALAHHMHGWRAAIGPGAVDSFVIMGELLLFAAVLLAWKAKLPYVVGALFAVWGFALSVGGNVWHTPSASPVDRAVAAIWPVTATAGLAGALIIIKRLTSPAAPSPGTSSGQHREPRPAKAEPGTRRAARAPGLVPAHPAGMLTEAEQALVLKLKALAGTWPSARELSRTEAAVSGSRRRAGLVLAAARAGSNGGRHDDGDGS